MNTNTQPSEHAMRAAKEWCMPQAKHPVVDDLAQCIDQHAIAPAVAERDAEIARLKANIGCAREQRSTQFCAEAAVAKNEVFLLAADLCDAERKLAEARADKERLDWLDENMSYKGGGNGGTYRFTTPADVECGMLRQAIDAARSATP